MAARKNPVRSPSHSPDKPAPSVEGLLGMMDLSPLIAQSAPAATAQASGPRVGKVVGLDSQGRPLLVYPGMAKTGGSKNGDRARSAKSPESKAGSGGEAPVPARSTVRVTASDAGREALIAFENGDLGLPIITGLLQAPEELPARIELQAGKEMVLKCGPASITLTKDGRIVIRGADVLTRSSGSNRIKGGSVHIN
jgi:uncharacterized protein DUF6484